jgi:hypothetical protein
MIYIYFCKKYFPNKLELLFNIIILLFAIYGTKVGI